MVVTVIVNHPAYVPFSTTHLFLFETILGPFQSALYLMTAAKKRGIPLEDHHLSRSVVILCGFFNLL
jgi:hypothetical protein